VSRTSLKIERLTVIGLASVISNCNRFSFTVASVTLEKEPTVLQRIEIRFQHASDVASKSVGRSNCVANHLDEERLFVAGNLIPT